MDARDGIIGLVPDIGRAATLIHKSWRKVIEEDDVFQELVEHLLRRPNSMEKLLGMSEWRRLRSLVMVGHQIAAQEREDYAQFSGNVFYGAKEVRDLLKDGALTTTPPVFNPAIADVVECVKLLPDNYQDAIIQRYVHNNKTDSTFLSRVTAKLTDKMNSAARRRWNEFYGSEEEYREKIAA